MTVLVVIENTVHVRIVCWLPALTALLVCNFRFCKQLPVALLP